MASKPRAARAARPASLPTTSVSRKLTKATKKDRPAKKRRLVAKPAKTIASKSPSWLKPEESLYIPESAAREIAHWPDWLSTRPNYGSATFSSSWAAEAIAWTERLSAVAAGREALAEEAVLLADLKIMAEEASALSLEANPLTHQLLRGELRIKLGVVTGDASLAEAGYQSILEGLGQLLDGEGTPHKKHLQEFPDLVACWLRSLRIIKRKKLDGLKLSEQQTEALANCKWLPLRLAQFSRAWGDRIFSPPDSAKIPASLILDGLKFWGDAKDRRNTACLRADLVKPVPKPAIEKLSRAVCGDWSGVAVFRSQPQPDSAYIGVAYEDHEFQLEFGAKSVPLVSGNAALHLTRDGHALAPTGVWEEVCRHQEPNVEYWELERTYERGVWVQRQIVLASKDEFAYVCDNIVADSAGDLGYSLELPLAKDTIATQADETREITLGAAKIRASLLPLAAEEWRTTPSNFDLQVVNERLRVTGATKKQRMAIPWIVDLRGGRKLEEVTWRQLRVAENLENLPRDIVVAFRWQIGQSQWMAYRSLAAPSNRTVLGQNLVGDFFLARLTSEGKTKMIVEIE